MWRKRVSVGIVVFLLVVFGVSQLRAQGNVTLESLSTLISTLSQRITEVGQRSATKDELAALKQRVATLEAKNGQTAVVSAASPLHSATPTQVKPKATPATPHVALSRTMNVRRGPGTNYAVIRTADAGEEFEITGHSAAGDWWRVDLDGERAWIYEPFVTAWSVDNVRIVSTPKPMPQPTATPSSG